MSDKHVSLVTDDNCHVIGQDTTVVRSDGSSTTTHQEAYRDFFGTHATDITGVTENKPDGTSSHRER